MLIKILSILILLAIVAFTIWGYIGYFQVEKTSYDASLTGLEEAKETKAMLEARDRAMLNLQKSLDQ
jgi:hypothetical protein